VVLFFLAVCFGGSAALPAAEAVMIGAGDIAKCGKQFADAQATAKLLDEFIASQPPVGESNRPESVIFTLGDHVYPRGSMETFSACYEPTWGRHKDRTRPAIGNHEYRGRSARPYFDYFGSAAGEPGKGYYSYNLGDWHIIVLNSVCTKVGGCGPGSPQYEWLAGDLKANQTRCTLAYMHHPLFSSGKHGGEKAIRPLGDLLYQSGVEIMLAGHEHNYERFAPQTPQGIADPHRGIRQFIVGTGGREHRKLKRPKPNSEARDSTSFGVLKLSLHPDSYDWEFLPVPGGKFQDSGSGQCH
jgi:hypothetical protein